MNTQTVTTTLGDLIFEITAAIEASTDETNCDPVLVQYILENVLTDCERVIC